MTYCVRDDNKTIPRPTSKSAATERRMYRARVWWRRTPLSFCFFIYLLKTSFLRCTGWFFVEWIQTTKAVFFYIFIWNPFYQIFNQNIWNLMSTKTKITQPLNVSLPALINFKTRVLTTIKWSLKITLKYPKD